ncbi:type II toxin-antitoxin system HicA family toxin [Aneurinibacillus terranovensis]|uniref:type II toxin-antitoxin system HicA family toxin n=1 Tax=Aneurinibacillus terranovensis TaxID=278991 RepID=UPI000413C0D9|nr:type II toxin-antitoxin system HicA family toxin [Aneurinibacillus terranovensis]
MARIEKLIRKMKNRPNGISFDEIAKALNYHGYILVRKNGSHRNFRNASGDVIIIKESNPVKAVYVKDVLARIGE